MTNGRKRASGLEAADIGFGLRPKNIVCRSQYALSATSRESGFNHSRVIIKIMANSEAIAVRFQNICIA